MQENEWQKLAGEAPVIQDAKNKVINDKLFAILNDVAGSNKDLNIFDYGCGWGEWANLLKSEGYKNIEAYDEADEMVEQAISKFGGTVKFRHRDKFKSGIENFKDKYDVVTSNLVLCILEKDKQLEMLNNMKTILKKDGTIIVSFCHPCFDYDLESLVSTRTAPEKAVYSEEFTYEKVIRENGIHFHDLHRPLEYFSDLFKEMNLSIIEIKESSVLGSTYKPDFIIFKLRFLA